MDLQELRCENGDPRALVTVFDGEEYDRVMDAHTRARTRNPIGRHLLDMWAEYKKPIEFPHDIKLTYRLLGRTAREMLAFKIQDEVDVAMAHQIEDFIASSQQSGQERKRKPHLRRIK